MASKNRHFSFGPGVVEFDGADRCAKSAEAVRLLCNRRYIDGAHMYASLQTASSVVLANINLPRAEELASLQIQPENLSESGPISA